MRGWSLSGSTKANRHWQSGRKGGHEYTFNPFSGYAKQDTFAKWAPMQGAQLGYNGTQNGADNVYVCSKGVAGTYGIFFGLNGVYVPADEDDLYTARIGKYYAKVPNLYGHISVRLKTDLPDDITFYWIGPGGTEGGWNNTSTGVLAYQNAETKVVHALTPTWSVPGSDDTIVAEIKVTGTRRTIIDPSWSGYNFFGFSLSDGFDIYVKMRDQGNDIFSLFSANQTIYGMDFMMYIEASRALTDDELSQIKDDTSTAFLITTRSEATTAEVFDGITAAE